MNEDTSVSPFQNGNAEIRAAPLYPSSTSGVDEVAAFVFTASIEIHSITKSESRASIQMII